MTSLATRLGFLTLILILVAGQASAQAPSREGIVVHGSWTITVTRDGKVVERREFQNELQEGGKVHISRLLARINSPGPWIILLEAEGTPNPDGTGTLCRDNEFILGADTDCAISQSAGEATATETNNTLVLEGTETVVRAANIEIVNTFQHWCGGGNIAPADCQPLGQSPAQVTRRTLETLIPVQEGDRIEVKVVISFS